MTVPGIIICNVGLIFIVVRIIRHYKKDQHPYNPKGVDDLFASNRPKTTVSDYNFKVHKPKVKYIKRRVYKN